MMFSFFNKNKSESEKEQKPEFAYAPELIGELKDDHQALLGIFGEIKAAFEAANYPLVTLKLRDFKTALMEHLLTEDTRLYIYMSRSFAGDEINGELVQGFHTEMNEIAKVVMTFLTRYETIGVDETLAATFATDLEVIGGALATRIDREESTLYPLYLPAY